MYVCGKKIVIQDWAKAQSSPGRMESTKRGCVNCLLLLLLPFRRSFSERHGSFPVLLWRSQKRWKEKEEGELENCRD